MTRSHALTKRHHLGSENAREFISKIKKDHQQGYRFAIFIGAGLSRPSGYPLPEHLGAYYLPYCVLRSLGIDPLSAEPRADRFPPWDPRTSTWPRMDEEIAERWSTPFERDGLRNCLPDLKDLTCVLTEMLDRATKDAGYLMQRFPDLHLSVRVIAAALGAMQEWRSTLRFLCQVVVRDGEVKMERPDYAVQDSMFQALLQLCEPALGHRMIAALCSVMRCDCIVTTNFDDLIERSFATVPLALSVFEVAHPAPLPGAAIVCDQRSLVKINGGRFSLTADETLDADPTEDDLNNFIGYLVGRGGDLKTKAALIVSGVGGVEPRTLALFRRAVARMPNLHIYWIAYGYDDKKANELASELDFDRATKGHKNARLWRLAHTEHGLLFQQLFMDITKSLPNSGVIFPGLWRLPLPPIIAVGGDLEKSSLVQEVDKAFRNSEHRIIAVLSTARESASRRACAVVAGRHANTAWLDLDQVGRPWGLLLRIVQMAARMHGTAEAPPALDYSRWPKESRPEFTETMKHLLRRYHVRLFGELTIFLCGLDEPGRHAPYAPGKGRTVKDYTSETLNECWRCLHEIALDRSCGVRFVIIGSCRGTPPGMTHRADNPLVDEHIPLDDDTVVGTHLERWMLGRTGIKPVRESSGARLFIQSRINEALAWAGDDLYRMCFLYLVSSFRHSAHPPGISRVFGRFAERALGGNYQQAFENSETWVRHWLMSGPPIVREKLGGLLWMHPRIKEAVHHEVGLKWRNRAEKDFGYQIMMLGNLLARHYGRLLVVTADPLASLEMIHHVLRSIEAAVDAGMLVRPMPASLRDQEALALHMVQHAIVGIKMARPQLERRLDSDFAEAALEGLESQLTVLREKCMHHDASRYRLLDRLLYRLQIEATMARGTLLLRSARSENLLGTASEMPRSPIEARIGHDLSSVGASKRKTETELTMPARRLVKRADSRDLKLIGARILSRQHDLATTQIVAVWNNLGQVVGVPVHDVTSCLTTTKPGPDRGDYHAREWLRRAWADAMPMNEADMEHWRRYIVRACLWSAMLLLNRAQALFLLQSLRGKSDQRRWHASLRAAIWIADFGLEALRNVEHSRDGVAMHEQVRLRCLAALCRAFGPPETAHNKQSYGPLAHVTRPLSILHDAASFIEEFPFREAEIERAIVALRGAEVRIVALCDDLKFKKLTKLIAKEKAEAPPLDARACAAFRQVVKGLDVTGLAASAEQALSLLVTAEQILRAHPKTSWWIWYLWALKSRVASFYFTLRAGHAIIQFEKPNSASVETLIHVPNILRNEVRGGIFSAISMQGIRDPFRIARIVESMCHVFAAETFRRRLPQTRKTERLIRLLETFAKHMKGALEQLRAQTNEYASKQADPHLISYCREILHRTELFVRDWGKAYAKETKG